MVIFYSPEFKRQFRKLSKDLQMIAIKREILFRKDPFSPTLKTHKLTGRLQRIWSFSLDYKNRILFRFLGGKTVLFESVGDHSIYRRHG